ncbi:hypothetical protein KY285_011354 [Solanum tuberosum]|nr:hypothetical protein KY285_011354 [Solanum tuberosum]
MMVGHENKFEIKLLEEQEHCFTRVLLCEKCTSRPSFFDEEQDDGQLEDRLQKLLKGRRYLVVIDDIWTTKAWVDMKNCFPDCNNGS